MKPTILVVDDEPRLVSLLKAYLSQEGYRVISAGNGLDALSLACRETPALIILDLMMPEMDGYEFMRRYRIEHDTPIILLTARVEDEEKVIGLELGADDYITKPFHPRELMARLKAVLRRTGVPRARSRVLRASGISLDRDSHMVIMGTSRVDLTPSEFELLAALMSSPGKVFSRLDLLEFIQGIRYQGYERAIDLHIKNLRAKIEPQPSSPVYIETVYGIGYRFVRNKK